MSETRWIDRSSSSSSFITTVYHYKNMTASEEEESSNAYSAPAASVAQSSRPISKKRQPAKQPSKPKPKTKKARADDRAQKEAEKKGRKKIAAAAAIRSVPGPGHRRRNDVEFDPDVHKMPQILHAKGSDGKGKAPNYIDAEDVVLCNAYIAGTLNPKKGAYQKADVFWSEIEQRYNKLLLDAATPCDLVFLRDAQSLKLRWKKLIMPAMNKFMKFYRYCYTNTKSGETDADILERACDDWQAQEDTVFKFKHCVLALKEGGLPQYDPGVSQDQVDDIEKGVSNAVASNAVDGNVMGSGLRRPTGSKAAKASEVLMKRRMEDKAVKSNLLGDLVAANQKMAQANHQIAFAISKGRAIENNVAMANMYFKMGNIAKATELMEAAEQERLRVPTPLSFRTSRVPKVITTEVITTGSKSTGLDDEESNENSSTLPEIVGKKNANSDTTKNVNDATEDPEVLPTLVGGVDTTVGICDAADSQCGNPSLQCRRHKCKKCGQYVHHMEPCSKCVDEEENVWWCVNCLVDEDV
jgi:hypothetical protein